MQRLVLRALLEHEAAGELPTSGRFVFYELEGPRLGPEVLAGRVPSRDRRRPPRAGSHRRADPSPRPRRHRIDVAGRRDPHGRRAPALPMATCAARRGAAGAGRRAPRRPGLAIVGIPCWDLSGAACWTSPTFRGAGRLLALTPPRLATKQHLDAARIRSRTGCRIGPVAGPDACALTNTKRPDAGGPDGRKGRRQARPRRQEWRWNPTSPIAGGPIAGTYSASEDMFSAGRSLEGLRWESW